MTLENLKRRIEKRELRRRILVSLSSAAAVTLLAAAWLLRPHSVEFAPFARVDGGAAVDRSTLATFRSEGSVTLYDGSRVDLQPLTSLSVDPPDHSRVVRFSGGRAVFRVAPSGRPFRVVTPVAEVWVMGTEFELSLPDPRALFVHVFEGQVEVRNHMGSRRLGPGDRAIVVPGEKPGSVPQDDEKKLKALVERLGSKSFEEREAAQRELEAFLDSDSKVSMLKALPVADAEVKDRISKAIRGAKRRREGSVVYIGHGDVWTVSADADEERQLTKDGNVTFLAVSPDHRRVLFITQYEIHVMSLDGGAIQKVGEVTRSFDKSYLSMASPACWSPDSRRIAYYGEAQGNGLYVMDADGNNSKKIADLKSWCMDIQWSPTGGKIAFIERVEVERETALGPMKRRLNELQVIEPDGKGKTPVSSGVGHTVSWSMDGKKLAFVKGSESRRTEAGICVASPDGSGVKNLVPIDSFAASGPIWSPDGSKLAFAVGERVSPGGIGAGTVVYTVGSDGKDLKKLVTTPASYGPLGHRYSPCWSPDGSKLACVVSDQVRGGRGDDPYGDRHLLVIDVQGESPLKVTENGCHHPAWIPYLKK
jgi:Tol biopolymer transport system component